MVCVFYFVGISSSPFRMSRADFLKNALFPRATIAGAFGPDAEYETFRVDPISGVASTDQFASDIVFGTIKLKGREDIRTVIKFKNADPKMSAMMNMHQKFHNEHAFYARLLPELARRSANPEEVFALFPRFIYSNATLDGTDGSDDAGGEQVIVITDLTSDGYRMSDDRLFLDADHVMLALRKLGALHGLSYSAKAHTDGARSFVDLTAALAETQWFDGYWFKSPRFLSGMTF